MQNTSGSSGSSSQETNVQSGNKTNKPGTNPGANRPGQDTNIKGNESTHSGGSGTR